jgi:hypothetical protein
MIADLEGLTDEFKMLAIKAQLIEVYVQPSQLYLFVQGRVDTLTMRRDPAFPFTQKLELLP